jgi:hypothetical protein
MDETGVTTTCCEAPFPRCREEVSTEEIQQEQAIALGWLHAQEEAMSETFLQEGRNELPIVEEGYGVWRNQQLRRLGQARQDWITRLTNAGWNLYSEDSRSLAYLRPDLAMEYDIEHPENPPIPLWASVANNDSVWWRCARNDTHQWRTSIRNRHDAGTGCPRCGKRGVSQREQKIFKALKQHLPGLVSPASVPRARNTGGQRRLRSWRVDMLLPGTPAVVVEYDGAYWHTEREEHDRLKADDLTTSGYIVVRIREHPLTQITENDILCASEQSADAIAVDVVQKLKDLPAWRQRIPPAGNSQETILSAWPDPAVDSGQQQPEVAEPSRIAMATLIQEALLAVHRTEVHLDRTFGGPLSDRFSQSPDTGRVYAISNLHTVISLCKTAAEIAEREKQSGIEI